MEHKREAEEREAQRKREAEESEAKRKREAEDRQREKEEHEAQCKCEERKRKLELADIHRQQELLKVTQELQQANLENQVWEVELERGGYIPMNDTEVRALVPTSVPTIPRQHESQQAVATPGPSYMLTFRNVDQSVPVERSRSLQPNPLERSLFPVASNPGVQGEPVSFRVFKSDLPKPELLKFGGNPMRYSLFISNFEAHIASKLVAQDNASKLQYLIQHCQGEAKQLIEFCTILSAEASYKRACELLHANYGKPWIIARAHIDHLSNGAKIKPTDWKNLVKLLHELE